ncbi:MAG: hypothetical protein Q6J68_04850 [Thermostichales cyanobacterium SZTDM-1c_bins_54]
MHRFFRFFLTNIELILTAVGLGVILLVGIISSYYGIPFWVATAIGATAVGIVHGVLFWLLRRQQRRVRQQAIREIREMLEDLMQNRLQTIRMSLSMVQLQHPGQQDIKEKFDNVYKTLKEISSIVGHISEESLISWQHRYLQTLDRIAKEQSWPLLKK